MAEAIYSSETAPARRTKNLPARRVQNAGSGRGPRTEYVLVTPKGSQQRTPGYRVAYQGRTPQNPRVPGLPQWMANKEIIFGAWFGTMVLVSLDDWKNNGILPRPMRLWYTSGVFFILAGLSIIDILAPLMSVLAVGFFFAVLWQYLTGTGQFVNTNPNAAGEAAAAGGAAAINSAIAAAKNTTSAVVNGATAVFGPGQRTKGGVTQGG
jgi:hypothetical protein